jgi:hypothetical protein
MKVKEILTGLVLLAALALLFFCVIILAHYAALLGTI